MPNILTLIETLGAVVLVGLGVALAFTFPLSFLIAAYLLIRQRGYYPHPGVRVPSGSSASSSPVIPCARAPSSICELDG